MLADGGDCLSDLRAVRDQAPLFGAVASDSTPFQVIDWVASEPGGLEALRRAHASARVRAWRLVRALRSHTRHLASLARALQHVGRAAKTIHLLDYCNDQPFRRRILTQLNRGESRHALARDVCHGYPGELRQRYRQGQEEQLGALGLIVNAIVLYNTIYTQRALDHLAANGLQIADVDVERLSPLGSDHLTLTGRYRIALLEALRDRGAYRELNANAGRRGLTRFSARTLYRPNSEKKGAAGNFKGGFSFHPLFPTSTRRVRRSPASSCPSRSGRRSSLSRRSPGARRQTRTAQSATTGRSPRSPICLSTPTGLRAHASLLAPSDPTRARKLSFTDHDGHRFEVILTDQTDEEFALIERRHRARAGVEDRSGQTKTAASKTPLPRLSDECRLLELVLIAHDLVAWTKALVLRGELAKAEPKRLRYRLLHVAARLAFSGRQAKLRLAADWPWATDLAAAFAGLKALPASAG